MAVSDRLAAPVAWPRHCACDRVRVDSQPFKSRPGTASVQQDPTQGKDGDRPRKVWSSGAPFSAGLLPVSRDAEMKSWCSRFFSRRDPETRGEQDEGSGGLQGRAPSSDKKSVTLGQGCVCVHARNRSGRGGRPYGRGRQQRLAEGVTCWRCVQEPMRTDCILRWREWLAELGAWSTVARERSWSRCARSRGEGGVRECAHKLAQWRSGVRRRQTRRLRMEPAHLPDVRFHLVTTHNTRSWRARRG